MSQLEKKYRVASFDSMYAAIERVGATPTIQMDATHYYTQLPTDDTLKMVAQKDKIEIHRLSTTNGLHNLEEVIPLASIEEGFAWFKAHGYHTLDVLTMHDEEYAYGDGGFALYTVDNRLHSVILGYSAEQLPAMEAAFGLQTAEQITLPYNKYMARLGMLRAVQL